MSVSNEKIANAVTVFPEKGMVMEPGYQGRTKHYNGRVLVIGKGRFGNGLTQGIKNSYVQIANGEFFEAKVKQVSCTEFMASSVDTMANQMDGADFICYTGVFLPQYAQTLARAIKIAANRNPYAPLEFMDFSNPDPTLEEADVPGALQVWKHLNTGNFRGHFKVWKITETGALDISGNEEPLHDYAKVYGAGIAMGETPKLKISGVRWQPAENGRSDLYAEAYDRIMERSGLDRWYDACCLAMAIYMITITYAIVRYHEKMNGKYPNSMIPLYIVDKGTSWTALWMMVVAPFAGNLLCMKAIFERWEQTNGLDRLLCLFGVVAMAFPIFEYILPFILFWIVRNLFVYWGLGRRPSYMYLKQQPNDSNTPAVPHACQGESRWLHPDASKGIKSSIKAMLVDHVTLKSETGCVGIVFVMAHSFAGFIIGDISYKGKWFNKETGRLHWQNEVSMYLGTVATALLLCVGLRSLFGKASWMKLKPFYTYLSPFAIALAVTHVVMMGYTGWHKLFKPESHNGQPSITFVSTFLPAATLVVNFLFNVAGTKKRLGNQHLWKHSATNYGKMQWAKLHAKLDSDFSDNATEFFSGDLHSVQKSGMMGDHSARTMRDDSSNSSGSIPNRLLGAMPSLKSEADDVSSEADDVPEVDV